MLLKESGFTFGNKHSRRDMGLIYAEKDGHIVIPEIKRNSYSIAGMSGTLGPKTTEGDKQAPEGFYRVFPHALNPQSRFHLSFNIGYPNAYDKSLSRTGSYIMVHGGKASVGCFAMTDAGIEEIYTLVNEAFKAGAESVPVQVYPFRMTPERMAQEADNEHLSGGMSNRTDDGGKQQRTVQFIHSQHH